MRRRSGWALVAALAVLSVVASVWLAFWAAGRAVRLVELIGLPVEEGRRGRELDEARRAALHRMELKEETIKAVLAGRLGLVEAAARFRDLDERNADFNWQAFRGIHPGASDDERHCRKVLAALEWFREQAPRRVDTARSRLGAELEQHLRRGPIRLPPRTGPNPSSACRERPPSSGTRRGGSSAWPPRAPRPRSAGTPPARRAFAAPRRPAPPRRPARAGRSPRG